MEPTAIIGFGCAGFHALKAMREGGCSGEIHVYDGAAQIPFNPMLSTYYLQGALPSGAPLPFGEEAQLRRRYGYTLHRVPVAHVTAARQVETADGVRRSYGRVLLATGARPFVPPGLSSLPGVFCMRTLEDARALEQALSGGHIRRAVVAGASMVGIKAAELLMERGVSCLLADLAPQLFPTAALPAMARHVQARLEALGLELALGAGLGPVKWDGDGLRIALGARTVRAQALILCMGTRPRLELLDGEPIQMDRGLVVDGHMRTSAPGVYAAGDCCCAYDRQSGANRPLGLWHLAARQGEVAGRCMAGLDDVYAGELPQNITHFFGLYLTCLGDNRLEGEELTHAPAGEDWCLLVRARGGVPVCVNLLGKPELSGLLKHLMLKNTTAPLPSGPLYGALLRRCGLPAKLSGLLLGGESA